MGCASSKHGSANISTNNNSEGIHNKGIIATQEQQKTFIQQDLRNEDVIKDKSAAKGTYQEKKVKLHKKRKDSHSSSSSSDDDDNKATKKIDFSNIKLVKTDIQTTHAGVTIPIASSQEDEIKEQDEGTDDTVDANPATEHTENIVDTTENPEVVVGSDHVLETVETECFDVNSEENKEIGVYHETCDSSTDVGKINESDKNEDVTVDETTHIANDNISNENNNADDDDAVTSAEHTSTETVKVSDQTEHKDVIDNNTVGKEIEESILLTDNNTVEEKGADEEVVNADAPDDVADAIPSEDVVDAVLSEDIVDAVPSEDVVDAIASEEVEGNIERSGSNVHEETCNVISEVENKDNAETTEEATTEVSSEDVIPHQNTEKENNLSNDETISAVAPENLTTEENNVSNEAKGILEQTVVEEG